MADDNDDEARFFTEASRELDAAMPRALQHAQTRAEALGVCAALFAEMAEDLRKTGPATFMEHHFGELPFAVRGAAWAAMNATVERHRETGWTPSASEITKFRHAVKAADLRNTDRILPSHRVDADLPSTLQRVANERELLHAIADAIPIRLFTEPLVGAGGARCMKLAMIAVEQMKRFASAPTSEDPR
jgi:hypothetical protein